LIHLRRIFLVFALLLAASPASAQVFGKNKVLYEPLDWAVLETPHLRFHFYAEEESLARHLVVFAESVCVEYDAKFRLESQKQIPFILFSAHHLFQQTNATYGLIPESTGGLTELIKGRVLLPHTGSWHRLKWVTRHELAHAYMLEKLSRVMRENKRSQNYMPPLWFIEGLAEFCGTQWDEDAEGLLRDAVLSGRAYPLTRSEPITGTVLMYKEGQSFLLYLAERFGEAKIFDLMDNWHRAEDFESGFKITFGHPLSEVDDEWFQSVRRRYYPVVAEAKAPDETGRKLTFRGPYNLGPRVLPATSAGDSAVRFCYFHAREGAVDLVVSEPKKNGGRRERRLLRGGLSARFESVHLFQNRPDASREGKIALSSKTGGRDALYILDANSGKLERRLEFPRIVAINDPVLLPGSQGAVFSAQDDGGRSDLYRAKWNTGKLTLERLTRDDYDDIEPDVSPDGKWVVFASDRGERGGRYSLFRLALESSGAPSVPGVPTSATTSSEGVAYASLDPTDPSITHKPADAAVRAGQIDRVSNPSKGDDRQPVYSPDGRWIAFRSTRGGTSDLYMRSSEPGAEVRRVTRLLGPASDPEWLANGRGLLYTAQHEVTFQTYKIPVQPESLTVEMESGDTVTPVLPVATHEDPTKRYQRRLGLDLTSNTVGVSTGMGGVGGASQIALSDILGNENIYLFIANDAERFGDFWDGWQFGVTYLNRSRRLNWGVGLFRLTEMYDQTRDAVRREKRFGTQGLASYAFNKFLRVEGTVTLRHASDHLMEDGTAGNVDLITNTLALVNDNTRWTWLGPTGGQRMYLGGSMTRDLTTGRGDVATVIAEARHYGMLLPNVVSATRVQGRTSFLRDAGQFYLGQSSLRGFERRALSGTRTLAFQEELRFPLIQRLRVALPASWEFPTVSGAVFSDAGYAWDDYGRPFKAGSVGFGFFILGGYFPALRWNYVWTTTDFQTLPSKPRAEFWIGFNF
jgi:hypothetical protein